MINTQQLIVNQLQDLIFLIMNQSNYLKQKNYAWLKK